MIFNIKSTRGQTRFLTCVARVTCLVLIMRTSILFLELFNTRIFLFMYDFYFSLNHFLCFLCEALSTNNTRYLLKCCLIYEFVTNLNRMSEVFTERGKVITFLKRSCCNERGCLNGKWEMLRMIPRIVLHSYIVVSNLYTCMVVVI